MVELTIRLIGSLAIVVGLLLVMIRVGARRFRPRAGAPMRLLHRQALSRSSAVAVVEVGSRILVLGHTEHQINLLAELDPEEMERGEELPEDEVEETATHEILQLTPRPSLEAVPSPALDLVRSAESPGRHRRAGARAAAPVRRVEATGSGPLAGSVLSPQTWRQALAAAKGQS